MQAIYYLIFLACLFLFSVSILLYNINWIELIWIELILNWLVACKHFVLVFSMFYFYLKM